MLFSPYSTLPFITSIITISLGILVFFKSTNKKIKQALLNIFLNAIDAMPTGGTLTVGTQLELNKPLATGHRPLVTVTITDTGGGIAPEDIKHIFDPFFSEKIA